MRDWRDDFDDWLDANLAAQGLTREITDPELLQRMANLLSLPPANARMTEYIECPVCHMRSYHPEDITNGYCGNCHAFTSS